MLLHSIKYHKSDVIGVLLGKKIDSKKIEVQDSVPLFHNKVTSGMLEIAFEMIEATLVNENLKIVGVYEAPILGADTIDFPSPLAVAIATQIKSHFTEPCIMSLASVNKRDPKDQDSSYMKIEVELNTMAQQGFSLTKRDVEGPDYRRVARYIEDKSYLGLCDFDDHFENVENDWRNTSLLQE